MGTSGEYDPIVIQCAGLKGLKLQKAQSFGKLY